MAQATGFQFDNETCDIKMSRGDTGSTWIHAGRKSGTPWTADDRCLFTVRDAQNVIVMQRIYRLDDQWGAGNGWFLMEFHNGDTDDWANGSYAIEWRYDVSPSWKSGSAPEGRCVDALLTGDEMTEGAIVRTVIQATLTLDDVYGRI